MANYQLLKADIDKKVYQNGKQEITGANLNSVLNAMVTTLGAEYQFAGVATTATNPGTPDAKVFYIANGKGTYTNFSGLEVTEDDVVVLTWDSSWHKVATGIASQEKLSELESNVGALNNGVYKKKAETSGHYSNLENGAIAAASNLIDGILFPVIENNSYHLGFTTGYDKVVAYNGNPLDNISQAKGKYIETVDVDSNGNFVAPAGAKYVMVDVLLSTFVPSSAYYVFKEGQDILNGIIEAKQADGLPWFTTNFLDPNDSDVTGGMFNSSGQIDTSQQVSFFVTGFIPLNEKFPVLVLGYDGVITTFGCNNNYYDADKNLIKTEPQKSSGNIVRWFEGAAYVRFSVWRNHNAQIEAGTTPTKYHPFQKDIWYLTNVSGVQDAVDEGSLSIDKVEFAHKNLFNSNDPDIITTGYLKVDGTLLTTPYFGVSGYIPFTKEMRNLICSQNGTPSNSGAALCYYDSNKQFLKGELLSAINGLATWFEGVAYIRWSFVTWDQTFMLNQVEVGTEVTEYVPYEDGFKIAENILELRKNNSILGGDAFSVHSDELASAQLFISDAPKYLTKNDKMSLYAGVSSFDSVYVGIGITDGGTNNRFLEITKSAINLLKGSSGVDGVAHGLTISTFIKVIISQNDQGSCHVVLQTLGGKFEHDFANWGYMSLGTPFVQSRNCTLTDVSLSYTNSDLKKSVWVIGDSYTVFERWPQYLKEWGFWNFALFGLPGGNSDHMYVDLYKALKKYMPKYLVWLVGMNDNNSDKTRDYKHILEALSYLCNSVGSELIVGITPSVPTINHDDKRAFILDKGYRYIDVYKAVGTNSSGQWYAGYLDSDGVHPSPLGSQAIATQILADFPEIMQY